MSDLIAFLRARLDEAQAAAEVDSTVPEPSFKAGTTWPFIAPSFRLADIEAKRQIIDEAEGQVRLAAQANTWDNWRDGWLRALRFLALPYADHPDYRQEWRP